MTIRARHALLAAALVLAAPGAATAEPVRVADLGGGFIEFLLGGARAPAPRVERAPRAEPAPRRAARPMPIAPRRQPQAPVASMPAAWGVSYCVRRCDGYAFPLGTMRGRGDAAAHARGCAAACPGAATELYVGSRAGGFAKARAVATGAPYGVHPAAFRHRTERVAGCTCAAPDAGPAARWASGDATLRRGDVLVTTNGALVFDGSRFVDPDETRAASPALRGRIDDRLGLTARAERLAAWRRAHPQAALRIDAARAAAAPATPLPPSRPGAHESADVAFADWGLRLR
ncbi:DUF2865 domain-containing protein [Salinarimonas sp.]|uniref:DUF2865 domain-containing protein n=1 Tax=Salinarimonas sp. TaxID=2766526 RepID=UPI0032D8F2C0